MNTDSITSELFFSWIGFWCFVGFGTTIGGSLFGFGIMFVEVRDFAAVFFGLLFGAIWAGTVGLFVIPSFALLAYICFCHRKPYILACIAGALTGIVSMPPLFFVTGPMGAVGAWFGARFFMKSSISSHIRQSESRRIANGRQPFNFTLSSMFARTTAAAVLLSFWTFVFRTAQRAFW